jgi:hypothetical protein
MKKIFASVTLLLIVLFLIVMPVMILTGCAKLVRTDYETVDVTIVDEHHRGAYTTPIRVGKVTTFQHHPAVYRIYVEYNGVQYSVSGHDIWERYKNMIGCTVPATLEIKTYDDGTVKHNVTAIGVEQDTNAGNETSE